MRKVYMRVDGPEELPVAVADTVKELAEICGASASAIYSMLCRGSGNYRAVEIEEDAADEQQTPSGKLPKLL